MTNPTNKDATYSLDQHIGQLLRNRRLMLGVTQKELGKILDISIAQLIKYEKGVNQISSSRLLAASNYLHLPISHFFDSFNSDCIKNTIKQIASEKELLNLFSLFNKVHNKEVRNSIIDILSRYIEVSNSNRLTYP